jgi:protein-disulfide isomerase
MEQIPIYSEPNNTVETIDEVSSTSERTRFMKDNIFSWLIMGILVIQVGLLLLLIQRVRALEQIFAPPPPVILDRIPDERGHEFGLDGAPVTIVEFADYQCPYCGAAAGPVKELLTKYPDGVRLVYRHFPLEGHPEAFQAAEAAECAGDQGKFWEMHEMLFANQRALGVEFLQDYAGKIGLDQNQFEDCMESGRTAARVKQDRSDGMKYGVNGSPTFFVNQRMVVGLAGLENAIEDVIYGLQ